MSRHVGTGRLRVDLERRPLRQLVDGQRERVDEGLRWSRAIGVTAIPTFVFNGSYGMVGAQELDAFRMMMTKIGQPPKA